MEKRVSLWWVQLSIWGLAPPSARSGAVWLSQVGSRRGRHVCSVAAIGHGMTYVGTDRGEIYALDVRAGGSRWSFQTQGAVQVPVAVVNDVVFAGSRDDNLYALTP